VNGCALIVAFSCALQPDSAGQPAAPPASADSAPIAFPHPLITEILYAVPNAAEGDANRDGSRHVAGDEFVEIINPHDKPINLLGYSITDRNAPKKGQLRFTFPSVVLPPRGIAVVFNGCEQGWAEAAPAATGGDAPTTGAPIIVGDSKRAPTAGNPHFSQALVFTMRMPNSRTSWANGGDYVLLSDPSGNPVHCVHWGRFKEPIPAATLVEEAPVTTKASVQRLSLRGLFAPHSDAVTESAIFSPGSFEPRPPPTPRVEAPPDSGTPTPADGGHPMPKLPKK
jgi:hypothetical protein